MSNTIAFRTFVMLGAIAFATISVAAGVTYEYNDKGQLATATYDDGTKVTYIYDLNGNRTSVVSTSQWGSDITPPTVPASITATVLSSTQINVSWSASTDFGASGLAGYKLERCQGGSCTDFQQIGTSTNLSYSDAGRIPSTTYRYRVRAHDNAGNHSGYSSIAVANTLADTSPPTTPGTPVFSNITGNSALATWSVSSDDVGVVSYSYSVSGSTWRSNGTSTSVLLTALAPATEYSLQVEASDGAGNTSGRSVNWFTTLDSAPPSAPGTPSASSVTYTSASISWSPASDNVGVTGYQYRLGTSGSFTNVGTATSVGLSGLTANTSYTVQVQARDAAGNFGALSQSTFNTTSPSITLPPEDGGTRTGSGAVVARYTLTNGGDILKPVSGQQADGGDWLSPKFNMGSFSARASGQGGCMGGTFNTWLRLDLPAEWTVTAPSVSGGNSYNICTFTLEIRNNVTGQIVSSRIQIVGYNTG